MASGQQQATTAVKVALRIRPIFDKDRSSNPRGSREVVVVPSSSNLSDPQDASQRQVVVDGRKRFTYDRVFSPGASQQLVYTTCVRALVERFIDGFNATVMAYGQTGGGKTYTMGSSKEYVALNNNPAASEGIISRAIKDVFDLLRRKEASGDAPSSTYTVSATFLEVYNEDLIDLLASQHARRSPVIIQETGSGTVLSGCNTIKLKTADDARSLFVQGLESRQTSTTEMNIASSRSHAIFSLTLVQESRSSTAVGPSRPVTVTSRFHFVDLAGSERLQRTGTVGARQREGIHINSGLLALGNVISALSDDSGRTTHVPYRDSKLTRLLQDSLGGNSNTVMIACISPIENDLSETLNTLKYANRAHKVRNLPSINKDVGDDEVTQLKEMVQKLKDEVKALKANSLADSTISSSGGTFPELETLQKDNQSLRRQLEERKEENLRLRAHRDYLANELAFVQSESTLRNINSSPAPSEAMSDIFSDTESVFSNTTGVSSIMDNDSTAGGSVSSRLPVSSAKKRAHRASGLPRAITPGNQVTGVNADSLMATVEEQERLIRRLRFDLREMTSAAQDYLRELEVQRIASERHEAAIELVEAQAADLRESVQELRSNLDDSNAKVATLEANLAASNGKVTTLETKLKQAEVDHSSADEYIAGLEAQLARRDGLASQVESLEADLEDARAEEARREAILADLERRLAESGDSVETIARISDLEADVAKFRGAWETAQARIEELTAASKKSGSVSAPADSLLSPPRSAPSSPPRSQARGLDIIPEESAQTDSSAGSPPVSPPANADLLQRLAASEEMVEDYKAMLLAAAEENVALEARLAELEKTTSSSTLMEDPSLNAVDDLQSASRDGDHRSTRSVTPDAELASAETASEVGDTAAENFKSEESPRSMSNVGEKVEPDTGSSAGVVPEAEYVKVKDDLATALSRAATAEMKLNLLIAAQAEETETETEDDGGPLTSTETKRLSTGSNSSSSSQGLVSGLMGRFSWGEKAPSPQEEMKKRLEMQESANAKLRQKLKALRTKMRILQMGSVTPATADMEGAAYEDGTAKASSTSTSHQSREVLQSVEEPIPDYKAMVEVAMTEIEELRRELEQREKRPAEPEIRSLPFESSTQTDSMADPVRLEAEAQTTHAFLAEALSQTEEINDGLEQTVLSKCQPSESFTQTEAEAEPIRQETEAQTIHASLAEVQSQTEEIQDLTALEAKIKQTELSLSQKEAELHAATVKAALAEDRVKDMEKNLEELNLTIAGLKSERQPKEVNGAVLARSLPSESFTQTDIEIEPVRLEAEAQTTEALVTEALSQTEDMDNYDLALGKAQSSESFTQTGAEAEPIRQETEAQTVEASLAEVQSQTEEVQDLAALEAKIKQMELSLSQKEAELRAAAEKVSAAEDRVKGVEKNLDELNLTIAGLKSEGQLTEMNDAVVARSLPSESFTQTDIEIEPVRLEAEAQTTEALVTEALSQTEDMDNYDLALGKAQSSESFTQTGAEAEPIRQETEAQTVEASFAEVQSQTEEVQDLAALEAKIKQMELSLSQKEAEMRAAAEKVSAAEKGFEEAASRSATLEKEVNALQVFDTKDDLPEKSAHTSRSLAVPVIDATSSISKIQELENTLVQKEAELRTVRVKVEKAESHVKDLEGKRMKDALDAAESTAYLQKEVAELNSTIAILQSELKSKEAQASLARSLLPEPFSSETKFRVEPIRQDAGAQTGETVVANDLSQTDKFDYMEPAASRSLPSEPSIQTEVEAQSTNLKTVAEPFQTALANVESQTEEAEERTRLIQLALDSKEAELKAATDKIAIAENRVQDVEKNLKSLNATIASLQSELKSKETEEASVARSPLSESFTQTDFVAEPVLLEAEAQTNPAALIEALSQTEEMNDTAEPTESSWNVSSSESFTQTELAAELARLETEAQTIQVSLAEVQLQTEEIQDYKTLEEKIKLLVLDINEKDLELETAANKAIAAEKSLEEVTSRAIALEKEMEAIRESASYVKDDLPKISAEGSRSLPAPVIGIAVNENKIKELEDTLACKDAELKAVLVKMDEVETLVRDLQSRREESTPAATDSTGSPQKEVEDLYTIIASLQSELKSKEGEHAILTKSLPTTSGSSTTDLTKENQKLKDDIESLKARLRNISDLKAQLLETASRHHTAEEMGAAKKRIAELEALLESGKRSFEIKTNEFNERIAHLTEEHRETSGDLEESLRKCAMLTLELNSLVAKAAELQKDLSSTKEQMLRDKATLEMKLEETEMHSTRALEDERANLNAKITNLSDKLRDSADSLSRCNESLKASDESLEMEKLGRAQESEEARKKFQEVTKAYSDVEATLKVTVDALEAEKKSSYEVEAKANVLAADLAAANALTAQYEGTIRDLEDRIVMLSNSQAEAIQKVNTVEGLLHADRIAHEAIVNEYQEKLRSLSTSNDEAVENARTTRDLFDTRKSEMSQTIEELEERIRLLSDEKAEALSHLEDARSKLEGHKANAEELSSEITLTLRSHMSELDEQAAEAAAIALATERLQKAQLADASKISSMESEIAILQASNEDKAKKLEAVGKELNSLRALSVDASDLSLKSQSLQARVKDLEYQLSIAERQPAKSAPPSPTPIVTRSLRSSIISPTSPTPLSSKSARSSMDGIPSDTSVMSLWRSLAKAEDHSRKQAEEIRRLEDRLAEQHHNLAQAKDDIATMEATTFKTLHSFKEASAQLAASRDEVKVLKVNVKQLEEQVEKLLTVEHPVILESEESRSRSLSSELPASDQNSNIESLQKELALSVESIRLMEARCKDLDDSLKKSITECESLRSVVISKDSQIEGLKRELSSHAQTIGSLEVRCSEVDDSLKKSLHECDSLRSTCDKVTAEMEGLQKEVALSTHKIGIMESRCGELETHLKRSLAEVESFRLVRAEMSSKDSQIESLQKELVSSTQSIKILEVRCSELDDSLKKSIGESLSLRTLCEEASSKEVQIKSLQQELTLSAQSVKALEGRCGELEGFLKTSLSESESLRSLSDEVHSKDSQIDALYKEVSTSAKNMETLEVRCRELEDSLKISRGEIDSLRLLCDKAISKDSQIDALQKELALSSQSLMTQEARCRELDGSLKKCLGECESLRLQCNEVNARHSQVEILEKELATSATNLENLGLRCNALEESLKKSLTESEVLRSACNEATSHIETLEKELASSAQNLATLEARCVELDQSLKKSSSEGESARSTARSKDAKIETLERDLTLSATNVGILEARCIEFDDSLKKSLAECESLRLMCDEASSTLLLKDSTIVHMRSDLDAATKALEVMKKELELTKAERDHSKSLSDQELAHYKSECNRLSLLVEQLTMKLTSLLGSARVEASTSETPSSDTPFLDSLERREVASRSMKTSLVENMALASSDPKERSYPVATTAIGIALTPEHDTLGLALKERDEARKEAAEMYRLLSSYASTSSSAIPRYDGVSYELASLREEVEILTEQRNALADQVTNLREYLDSVCHAYARVAGIRLHNKRIMFVSTPLEDMQIVRPLTVEQQLPLFEKALNEAERQIHDLKIKNASAESQIAALEARNRDQIEMTKPLQVSVVGKQPPTPPAKSGHESLISLQNLEDTVQTQASEINRLTGELARLQMLLMTTTRTEVTYSQNGNYGKRELQTIPEEVRGTMPIAAHAYRDSITSSTAVGASEVTPGDRSSARTPASSGANLRRRSRSSMNPRNVQHEEGTERMSRTLPERRSQTALAAAAESQELPLEDEELPDDYFLPSVFFNDLVPDGELPAESPVKYPLRVLLTMKRVSQITSKDYVEQLRRHVVNLDIALGKANNRILELQRVEDSLKAEVGKGKIEVHEALRRLAESESTRGYLEIRVRELRRRKANPWCCLRAGTDENF
ncbi:Kinesin-like protein kif21b [Dinochytrium kinnereticum]|nr:Kinesin-like protein kif21b [Dinochytrium kinnereticum]